MGKLHGVIKKEYRTNWANHTLDSLSAQWAFTQMARWLNDDPNYKYYRAIASERAIMFKSEGEITCLHLVESDSGAGDSLNQTNFPEDRVMHADNALLVNPNGTADVVFDWLYNEY